MTKREISILLSTFCHYYHYHKWASFPPVQTFLRSYSPEPEKRERERIRKKRSKLYLTLQHPAEQVRDWLGEDKGSARRHKSLTHGNHCSKKVPGFIHKPSCSYTGLPHFTQDSGASWRRRVMGFEPQSRCFNCCDIQHAHIIWEIVYPEVVCIQAQHTQCSPHFWQLFSTLVSQMCFSALLQVSTGDLFAHQTDVSPCTLVAAF